MGGTCLRADLGLCLLDTPSRIDNRACTELRYVASGDFDRGIIIRGTGAMMKISGYVKVDLIYDYDSIDSKAYGWSRVYKIRVGL